MVSIGDTVSEWKVVAILVNRSSRQVIRVKNDQEERIMKIFYNCAEEFDEMKHIIKIKNEISAPPSIIQPLTISQEQKWFTMKSFECSLTEDLIFGAIHLKKFMCDMIDALQFLHLKLNLFHGDFKSDNILIEKSKILFVLCDLETASEPKMETIEEKSSKGYYYFLLGAQRKKSYKTFRFDLEALGYLIWLLLKTYNNDPHLFNWQREAIRCYEGRSRKGYFYLEKLRREENKNMPDSIKKYFEILEESVPWSLDKIPNEVYEKILGIS